MNKKKIRNNCLNCGIECKRFGYIYCSIKCQQELKLKKLYLKWDAEGKFPNNKNLKSIRNYLIKKYDNICSICGLSEWLSSPILLIVDHIDGYYLNTNISNFRLICSNCDSTLSTYKGRNKGNGRKYRNIKLATVA